MKQLEALRELKTRPYYREQMYLTTWKERSGERHAILTLEDVIGWGFSWEAALQDADRRQCGSKEAKR
jgi:hypothetical protein